jgi:hypothetical protein
MIHLNLSSRALEHNGLEAGEEADRPTPGIYFKSWFVDVFPAGIPDEYVTLFVNEKSFLCIAVPGESLAANYNLFQERFIWLLKKLAIPKEKIIAEIKAFQDCCILEAADASFSDAIKQDLMILRSQISKNETSFEDSKKWDKAHEEMLRQVSNRDTGLRADLSQTLWQYMPLFTRITPNLHTEWPCLRQ